MGQKVTYPLEFDGFTFDPHLLRNGSGALHLAPKAMELLALLIQRSPDVVPTEEIADVLWPDDAPNYGENIYAYTSAIRKHIGGHIQTVPKKGLRFVPHIESPLLTESKPDASAQFAERLDGDPFGQAIAQEHGPFLKRILFDEITRMLGSTDIFDRSKMVRDVKDIITDESFVRVAGQGDVSLVHPIELELGSSNRLGRLGIEDDGEPSMIHKAFDRRAPLRFAVAPAQAGAAAIFTYMKRLMHYNIDIGYGFAHSPEMAKRMIEKSFSRPPDVCVLGSAATATVLLHRRRLEYSPLMIMPKISHRVVATSTDTSVGYEGHYVAISDEPSTTRFYFEKLIRMGLVAGTSVIDHGDPDQTTVLLSQGDPDLRAAMWFPCYTFNREWNSCTILDIDDTARGDQGTVLFAREELARDADFVFALSVAIRDAWLALRSSPTLVSLVVDEMLREFPASLHEIRRA